MRNWANNGKSTPFRQPLLSESTIHLFFFHCADKFSHLNDVIDMHTIHAHICCGKSRCSKLKHRDQWYDSITQNEQEFGAENGIIWHQTSQLYRLQQNGKYVQLATHRQNLYIEVHESNIRSLACRQKKLRTVGLNDASWAVQCRWKDKNLLYGPIAN